MSENSGYRELRLFFKKSGRAIYISHLDLMRTMTRAVRRAGIPVWYTEGFNRHPYLTFAAPLSLGYEGLEESMDIRVAGEMTDCETASRLQAVMPEGLTVLRAASPVMKPGEITAAVYRITFEEAGQLAQFLAQDSISVSKRTKKGGVREIDILPHLHDIKLEDSGILTVTLPAGGSLNINPSLLIDAFQNFTGEALSCKVTRICVLARNGSLFE